MSKIKYIWILVLALYLTTIMTGTISADEHSSNYSPYFFGLGTELTVLPGASDSMFADASVESLCWTASLGHRDIFSYPNIRARGGLGFWPGRYFLAKIGIELPVFEKLNQMHARMFGLYGYLDCVLRIGPSGVNLSFNPSTRFLVPISPIGGLAFGLGYDTTHKMTWHVDYLAGFYAIQ